MEELVEVKRLRGPLIAYAKAGKTINYSEVAERFRQPWSRGFGTALTASLNKLADENKAAGEPLLMCLVVTKATGLPGKGYYFAVGQGHLDEAGQKAYLDKEIERCQQWDWS